MSKTDAEAPAPQAEQSTLLADKTFPARTVKNRHISVSYGRTRQIGNDYVKIVQGEEMDIQPAVASAETRARLTAELRESVEHAFELEKAATGSKPQDVQATPQTPTKPPIRSDNPYEKLPFWKQSEKRKNLRTFKVTTEVLGNPIAKELVDRVKEYGSMRVLTKSYRYSLYDNQEYVQEWSQLA